MASVKGRRHTRFIRTVCGDVPSVQIGRFYSHEHVVIKGAFFERHFPEFILQDIEKICKELTELHRIGIGAMVDAMPIDAGRSAADLAEVSLRTGIHIVAPTGLHLRLYYPANHWYDVIGEEDLARKFIGEIETGIIDEGMKTCHKAGVIKVAGSRDQLTDLERRNFRAAGSAQRETGCPVLTHTEQGTAALEQIRLLLDAGASPAHVVLSHLDRNPDLGYHREVLAAGVKLEFDSCFRWKGEPNQTLKLLLALAPDFPDSFVLGMDAAKFAYWHSFGGSPGLTYLFAEFAPALVAAGLSQALVDRMFIENPAEAYSFCV